MRLGTTVLAFVSGILAAGASLPAAAQTPSADQLKEEAFAAIDENAERLGRLSDAIFS